MDWNGAWLVKGCRQYNILQRAMRKAGKDKSFDAADAAEWAKIQKPDACITLSIMHRRGILKRVGRGQYEVNRG